jgi:NAD(P)-dependent dehydrogenase (short-subunit alcohol dehydrogenase family)
LNINLKPIGAQVAVVFGASSGIGRLTALEFAKRGAKVCVAARSEEGLKSLVSEIEENGGDAFYALADAADYEQVKSVAEKTVERYGRLDTWIHSAAAFLFAPFIDTEPEEYRRLIEVNLLGQIYGAKAAFPHLEKRGGALIHITSVEAWRTVPFQSAYGASKHGIYGFLQALRVEFAHKEIPIAVTQILPAAINTPIYDKGRNKMPFKPRPVPPIYHPQVVADAILYAAENPTKDLIAGGAGLGVVGAERLSPSLTDWITEKVGFVGQKTDIPNPGDYDGNLFEPMEGFDTVEGRFSEEQFESDPYRFYSTRPNVRNGLLATGAIIGAAFIWNALRKKQ